MITTVTLIIIMIKIVNLMLITSITMIVIAMINPILTTPIDLTALTNE